MMDKILSIDGPLLAFLNKTGQLIALSCLWLLGCIPVVTAPAATAALYYAACKAVRFETGSAVKEFAQSFRRNLLRGMAAGIPVALLAGVLMQNLRILTEQAGSNALRWGTLTGLALLASVSLYLCPVLSRFALKVTDVWKLSFVMALRFLPMTVLLLAGAGLGAAAQFYLLPVPALAIVPGAVCLAYTWPMEKALRRYMPPKEENDSSWYYR